jgi:hypothetical protein
MAPNPAGLDHNALLRHAFEAAWRSHSQGDRPFERR